jgi:hypothetical protein
LLSTALFLNFKIVDNLNFFCLSYSKALFAQKITIREAITHIYAILDIILFKIDSISIFEKKLSHMNTFTIATYYVFNCIQCNKLIFTFSILH